jgi:RNA polymerase sigma-70 factor, ECF subfamily
MIAEHRPMLSEPSDDTLIHRCCAGDTEAFAPIVRRYRDRMVSVAYQLIGDRDEAESVAQDAFVQAFTHLSSFEGRSQLYTWLYRITVNACRMHLRRRRVAALAEEPPAARGGDWAPCDERWLVQERVGTVLRRLPEALRVALTLREMHELSYIEIADVMDIPVGTVRSRLFEARRLFADHWRSLYPDASPGALPDARRSP